MGHVHLDASIGPTVHELPAQPIEILRALSRAPPKIVEKGLAPGEVHRTAIVRIDEGQVPQLRPLIEVGNPRRGDLEERLGERVDRSVEGDQSLEWEKGVDEPAPGGEEPGDEVAQRLVVPGIRIDPARPSLGFLRGLFHVARHALHQ